MITKVCGCKNNSCTIDHKEKKAEFQTYSESERPRPVRHRPALLREISVEVEIVGSQSHALARKQEERLRRYLFATNVESIQCSNGQPSRKCCGQDPILVQYQDLSTQKSITRTAGCMKKTVTIVAVIHLSRTIVHQSRSSSLNMIR